MIGGVQSVNVFWLVPTSCSNQENKVADRSPEDIGLRLTVDGFLTADICMDLPPLRTVLLDPYTGWALNTHPRALYSVLVHVYMCTGTCVLVHVYMCTCVLVGTHIHTVVGTHIYTQW